MLEDPEHNKPITPEDKLIEETKIRLNQGKKKYFKLLHQVREKEKEKEKKQKEKIKKIAKTLHKKVSSFIENENE